HCPRRPGERFASAPDFIAGNDARIGERDATRPRSATEGCDERAGMKRALSVQDPTLWQSAKPRSPAGLDERFASAFVGPPQSPGNAPQPSGTAGGEGR